jgi:hypothetical protein
MATIGSVEEFQTNVQNVFDEAVLIGPNQFKEDDAFWKACVKIYEEGFKDGQKYAGMVRQAVFIQDGDPGEDGIPPGHLAFPGDHDYPPPAPYYTASSGPEGKKYQYFDGKETKEITEQEYEEGTKPKR